MNGDVIVDIAHGRALHQRVLERRYAEREATISKRFDISQILVDAVEAVMEKTGVERRAAVDMFNIEWRAFVKALREYEAYEASLKRRSEEGDNDE